MSNKISFNVPTLPRKLVWASGAFFRRNAAYGVVPIHDEHSSSLLGAMNSAKTKKRQSSDKSNINSDEKKARTSIDNGNLTSKYFKTSEEADMGAGSDNGITETGTGKKLSFDFFDRPCPDLAKALLGKTFVRKLQDDSILEATIVETEAYLGGEDKAAHSYNGKRTQRNEAMFMKPGTIYVYNIYGMYTCINISSQGTCMFISFRTNGFPIDFVALKDLKFKNISGIRRHPFSLCLTLFNLHPCVDLGVTVYKSDRH